MNKVLQTIAIMLRPLYMQWPLASSAEDCDCTWSKTTNTSKGKSTHPLMTYLIPSKLNNGETC